MDILEKLHCDEVYMPCRPAKLRAARNKVMQPFQSPRQKLLSRFPLNYRKDPEDDRDLIFESTFPNLLETVSTLPARVDHTSNMSSVKDQGELGSCVGFAISAMKECQEKKEHEEELAKGKRGRSKVYDYSESWVYWNAKKIDPWPGEEGTSIRYAMKVLQKIGVPTEKGWPYKDVGDVGEPESWAKMVARWALIDSYWRIDSLDELKLALNDGPVPIGIPCFYEFFFVGSDGYVPFPEYADDIYGGHAVCAVAYNDKTGLIKFKNSWGKDWGAGGYGYLSYLYIEEFLWDAWACKDLSVTNEMLKGVRTLI